MGLCNSIQMDHSYKSLPSHQKPLMFTFNDRSQNSQTTNQGIIDYLGKNYNREKQYTNPAYCKILEVRKSSDYVEVKTKPMEILDSAPTMCITKAEPRGWILFDFKQLQIKPNAYSIAHGAQNDRWCLRRWNFEGSVDGLHWNTISQHKNCKNINKFGVMVTFPIDTNRSALFVSGYIRQITSCEHTYGSIPNAVATTMERFGCHEYYNQFRIISTGINSSRNHCVCLAGFEIYGALRTDLEDKEEVGVHAVPQLRNFISFPYI
eukprot:110323_1